MLTFQEVRGRNILIDSNILIHYATEGFKDRSGNFLRVLKDNGNSLAASPITAFEILCAETKPKIREKYFSFLNYIPTLQMEKGYFQNAAVLASEYRRVCNKTNIPPCDLMIGGAVLAHSFSEPKIMLLTTDRNDFCEPFWITVAHLAVPYQDQQKIEANVYLLEFNINVLSPENHPPSEF